MTLDASKPNNQEIVSSYAGYIREARAAINAISGAGGVGHTNLTIAALTTSLTVGVDIGNFSLETVKVTGGGVVDIESILGGTEGQVKVLIFQDGNVDLVDSVSKANGTFYLNHLPAGSDYSPAQDDVIALVNIDGDGAAVHGYWKELFRTTSVK